MREGESSSRFDGAIDCGDDQGFDAETVKGTGLSKPVLLGQGESLFEGIDLPGLGYRVEQHVFSAAAMHS